MAGVRWGSRCKGYRSKEGPHYCLMQSARNMTINLIHELEIPWGFHTRAVLHSSAGLMSCEKVSVRGFLWVKKIWFAFTQWMFARETFGKKAESVLLWETPHAMLKIWGRMYDVLPHSAKGTRHGTRNQIPMQLRKGAIKLVSSNYAKNTRIRK